MATRKESEPPDAHALRVDFDGSDDLVAEFDHTLSSGRAFFATDHAYGEGAKVRLLFTFAGLRSPIVVDAVVVGERVEASEPGVVVELEEKARAALAEMIERLRRRDPALVRRVLRVLLVEDNHHVADLIKGGLRTVTDDLSFELATAADGREALRLLSSKPFDLAIVDIYLPVVDGAEVIRRARTELSLGRLPILAVSAGGQSAREAAVTAGASEFVDKPVRLRQVVELVRKLCAA
ncbi:MAG: response regulator [Deltaproteobacteria bacterium]|nr:response regulator [Kofleriaceae bacterium]